MAMIELFEGYYVNPEDIVTVEATQRYISIRQRTHTVGFIPTELQEEIKDKKPQDAYLLLKAWVDTFVGTINNQKKTTETVTDSNIKTKRTTDDLTKDAELFDKLQNLEFDVKLAEDTTINPHRWHWHRVHSDTIEMVRGIYMNDLNKKIKVLKEELNIE